MKRNESPVDGMTAEQYGEALGARCEYAFGPGWLDISDADLAKQTAAAQERTRVAVQSALDQLARKRALAEAERLAALCQTCGGWGAIPDERGYVPCPSCNTKARRSA